MPVKVRVRGFQSIHDATVLIDRFTVVTGTNNSGKTALQRAIRGVFQNTGGTAFIREGEKKCVVSVDLGDHTVEWSKGTGKRDRPTYVIDGGDPLYPGSAVPDEVAALGITPITAGGQEVWPTIAPQFTGQVFLLDRPGSALAEAVADVERVGQLNRALRSAESDRRQTQAALKVRRADLIQHEAEVAGYDGLDEAVAGVGELEARSEQLATNARAVQRLTLLNTRLQAAQAVVADLKPVEDITIPEEVGVVEVLDGLDTLYGLRRRLTKARAEEARLTGVDAVLVDVDEGAPKRLLEALAVLGGLGERLSAAQERVVGGQVKLDEAEAELIQAAASAEDALVEMGECPVCHVSTEQGVSR